MSTLATSHGRWHLRQAVHCLAAGGLLAYPTEAVYGLGCDPLNPDAVMGLLALKQRPMAKGLIVVASHWEQLSPFVLPLTARQQQRMLADWPGPVTWVVPCHPDTPQWLRGDHDSLAVRVSAHETVTALCAAWGGPLVSTSANLSGRPPCRSALAVRRQFGAQIDYVLPGPLGDRARPTRIHDARSGRVLRSD